MASNDAPDASDDGPYHHGLEAPKTFKKHHKNSCFCIAWSHDCEIIYSGGGDNTTRVWKADGTLLHTITDKRGGHASHTTCVSTRIAEDGEEELVTGSYDETVRFWRKKGAVKVREEKNTMVYCMAVSKSGLFVACGNNDGKIRMFDAEDGTHRAMLLGPKTAILSIGWSPDDVSLCCGSRDERAYTWKLGNLKHGPDEEMRLLQQEYHRFDGHKNDVCGIAWHPDGAWIVTCAHDSTIRVWHSGSGRLVYKIDIPLPEDYESEDWDSDDEDNERTKQMRDRQRNANSAMCVAWSLDGRNLISGHLKGALRIWSSGGNLLHKYQGHGNECIYKIAISRFGDVATCGEDFCVAVWKPITAETARLKRKEQDDAVAALTGKEAPDASVAAPAADAAAAVAEVKLAPEAAETGKKSAEVDDDDELATVE